MKNLEALLFSECTAVNTFPPDSLSHSPELLTCYKSRETSREGEREDVAMSIFSSSASLTDGHNNTMTKEVAWFSSSLYTGVILTTSKMCFNTILLSNTVPDA